VLALHENSMPTFKSVKIKINQPQLFAILQIFAVRFMGQKRRPDLRHLH